VLDPVTHPYGLEEVERLLTLSRGPIRAFVDAGFVAPQRGARNALRFSFQDLVVLRTAQALADAKLSKARITRSLKELRKQLPESMPLKGLAIGVDGDRLVVKQGATRWQADSGQYLLGLEADDIGRGRTPTPVAQRATENGVRPRAHPDADDLFSTAASLESADAEAAIHAYEQAIAADPCHLDARINLGRLLHERGKHAASERAYRDALDACGADATLLFNFGVLLDDLGRFADAIAAYEGALRLDPSMADCHYNLALLHERRRQPKEALRHMSRYKSLTR
jgi:tetratricopeptide (TPR) repeat protein